MGRFAALQDIPLADLGVACAWLEHEVVAKFPATGQGGRLFRHGRRHAWIPQAVESLAYSGHPGYSAFRDRLQRAGVD
jgi:hypothetical protein